MTQKYLDFHAMRHNFTSAGVPRNILDIVTGHEREGLTLGTYSQGSRVDWSLQADAVARISYKEIDEVVEATVKRIIAGKQFTRPAKK